MTSPALARPGAVAADPPDAGVAAHYGDPMREQRLLADGVGTVDLSHRGVLAVSGPDRLTWLHSLTSQFFEGLAPDSETHETSPRQRMCLELARNFAFVRRAPTR